MDKILIIEDDKAVLMGLREDLEFEGYQVSCASDGKEGLKLALKDDFQIIILDLILPSLSGLEVCKKIRETGNKTPVLMLTAAKTEEMDKVTGLEMGADDYVIKPVGSRELVARIKAILRRSESASPDMAFFKFGDVSVDFASHKVKKSGKPIHLTALEFKILKCLIENKGRVLSRDDILRCAWDDAVVSPKTIDPHIVHLRKKIETNPESPEYIISVRSVGYKFEG